MVTKRYSVDRVVSGIAVLVADEGGEITLDAEEYGLSANDVLDITFDGDRLARLARLVRCDGERDRRLKENRDRLHSLFKNKKKN